MNIKIILNNLGIESLANNEQNKIGSKILDILKSTYIKDNKEIFNTGNNKCIFKYNNRGANKSVEIFAFGLTDNVSDKTELFKKFRLALSTSPLIPKDYDLRFNNTSMDKVEKNSNNTASVGRNTPENEFDYEQKAMLYTASEPKYTFDQVILNKNVLNDIEEALAILECERKVFDEWGLRCIEPSPSTSLSFYGPPGTGKTMAAEAIANKLGKKILRVSYADIESKYVGEGPKMVKAIFMAAERDDAVLFIDESDSMLSKRLQNTSNGSDQSINSMRSQLLISLEHFSGIVIFATNLVVNYDKAFISRLISIKFELPDIDERKRIWEVHIKPSEKHRINIPLADDVDINVLAEKYEFVGREIKKAVIKACVGAARGKRDCVCQQDFIDACEKIKIETENLRKANDYTDSSADAEKKALIKKAIEKKVQDAEEISIGEISG